MVQWLRERWCRCVPRVHIQGRQLEYLNNLCQIQGLVLVLLLLFPLLLSSSYNIVPLETWINFFPSLQKGKSRDVLDIPWSVPLHKKASFIPVCDVLFLAQLRAITLSPPAPTFSFSILHSWERDGRKEKDVNAKKEEKKRPSLFLSQVDLRIFAFILFSFSCILKTFLLPPRTKTWLSTSLYSSLLSPSVSSTTTFFNFASLSRFSGFLTFCANFEYSSALGMRGPRVECFFLTSLFSGCWSLTHKSIYGNVDAIQQFNPSLFPLNLLNTRTPFFLSLPLSIQFLLTSNFRRENEKSWRKRGSPGKIGCVEYSPTSMTTTCQSFLKVEHNGLKKEMEYNNTFGKGREWKYGMEPFGHRDSIPFSFSPFVLLLHSLLFIYRFLSGKTYFNSTPIFFVSLIIHNHFSLLFHHPQFHPLLHQFSFFEKSFFHRIDSAGKERKEKITFSPSARISIFFFTISFVLSGASWNS